MTAFIGFLLLIAFIWGLVLLRSIARRLDDLPSRSELRRLLEESRGPQAAGPKPAPFVAPPLHAAQPALVPAEATPPPVPTVPHVEAAPAPAPAPKPASPPPPVRTPGVFETAAREMLRKAWNWFVVGEEFRRKDVPAEFAIASNWLVRAGIFVLVFGAGFFLKYSIVHGLLGPQARVALSVLAGTGLVVWGLRLFGRQYHLLGQGLVGGGLAMLYFSTYSAASMFHLLPVGPAFGLMALVTFAAGLLAVRYDSLLVAVLGLLGGYATPVMLSTGEKNFPVLFGYMTLLGVGLLGVAWRKRWPLLTYLSLLCTHALAVGAIARHFVPGDLSVVLPFLGVFFALFSTAIFLYNLAHRERTTVIELLGLFLNAGFFFGAGYHVVVQVHPRAAAAWLAIGLAFYYTAHVVALVRRGPRDRALLTAFIALAAVFVVLTLPLVLSRSWLTATWAVQAVALLWIALKLDSPTLRRIASAVLLVVLFRLVIWDFPDRFDAPTPARWADYLRLLADRAAQFGLVILSFGAARWLLARAPAPAAFVPAAGAPTHLTEKRVESRVALGIGLLALCAYLTAESWHLFAVAFPPMQLPAMTMVWAGFGVYLLASRRHLGPGLLCGFFIAALCILLFKGLVDLVSWDPDLTTLAYSLSERVAGRALVRLADFATLLAFFGAGWALLRGSPVVRIAAVVSGWLAIALGWLYLTLEAGTALTQFVPGFRGGGISVLWGLYAFALLVAGIRRSSRSLRLVGLAIFGVTVVKIFASDLARLDAIYRIVAFVLLGIVLLLAAFMYLKHRRRFEVTAPKEITP